MDYVQLLMISRAIRAKNINQNAKKTKRPPKSSKIKMFIFGLCSTSDERLSDPSKKCQTKHKTNKKGPLSHWKIKCSFLDYIQLLMIGRVIWVTNGDWNAKKGPLSHQKWNVHFLMVYPKTTRRPAEDCQKTMRDCQKTSRRLSEDHQKASGCLWQSSNTMIQGNFYKRLHFYMNSCAISPTALLFVEYTEKKTSVFQIQLEFWVNMTLCFWLMYTPSPTPWKSWILSKL